MPDAAATKAWLEERFGAQAAAPRARRVFAEVPAGSLRAVLEVAREELGFDALCAITGLDEGESLAAIYHLACAHGTVLSLKTRVPRASPSLPTVTDLFPGAADYERELDDLLGFHIEGLPPGRRYPLPEDFPRDQKPLRKDWSAR
ncbi:MAG TPA: NADH-quinone oxidoreductase subunit C [Myxococcales bacterium]|nr:NADH-quinone oxidoreductase subunit C [Myxococcales bacterium]